MEIVFQPIGTIYSPFHDISDMPIQPGGAEGVHGRIEILPELVPALKDLEGFSHIILIYHFHRAGNYRSMVIPFLDDQPHGLFATRAPARPNPIGLSVVRLLHVEANQLHITNVDILDGTPLLDLKPYVPNFDQPEAARVGWLEETSGQARQMKSDNRFRQEK
jgi:tRNA-Thr(GGU) m(6)t(6)A37 methyltransferase TsaA